MKTKIVITKRTIEAARRKLKLPGTMPSRHCAVSRALKKAFPGKDVSSNATHLHVDGQRFATPCEVSAFIAAFDAGEPVQPFSFELNAAPQAVLTQ